MKKERVKEWIYKAEEDFESARQLAKKTTKVVPNVVCFHCRQSIEKYLKAFLIWHDIEPPAIHDLQRLNNICIKIDKDFNLISEQLNSLNAYAVDFRYPGENATIEESKSAVQIMKHVRKFLRNKLKLERKSEI